MYMKKTLLFIIFMIFNTKPINENNKDNFEWLECPSLNIKYSDNYQACKKLKSMLEDIQIIDKESKQLLIGRFCSGFEMFMKLRKQLMEEIKKTTEEINNDPQFKLYLKHCNKETQEYFNNEDKSDIN